MHCINYASSANMANTFKCFIGASSSQGPRGWLQEAYVQHTLASLLYDLHKGFYGMGGGGGGWRVVKTGLWSSPSIWAKAGGHLSLSLLREHRLSGEEARCKMDAA